MRTVLAVLALALVAGLAACGGGDPKKSAPPPEPATAKPADFPSAKGKTREELVRGLQEGPVLAPSTSQLQVGSNRFGFALFDTARKQVEASAVAIYTSNRNGTGLRGPFPARRESMGVKGPFRSAQARSDLENGDTIYVATVPFSRTGSHVL